MAGAAGLKGRYGRAMPISGRPAWVVAACGLACALVVIWTLGPAGGHGPLGGAETARAQADCNGDLDAPEPKAGAPPLVMGIYPGGLAGQIGPPKPPKPEDGAERLDALERLRGDREFAVHLYVKFSGDGKSDTDNARIGRELDDYMARGYEGELVVTYRPAARRGAPDVADFVAYTREVVRRFGPDPRFRSIQVTNEVTNDLSPDASDGAFPAARDALIGGVIAAKEEARRGGFDQLEVGFNWLYRLDPDREEKFWTYLGEKGGPRFLDALDWVGVDAYPGTFFPPAVQPGGERNSLVNAFSVLRECFLPLAKIPKSVPLHVSENGYPTSPARTYEQQEGFLRSMVGTVSELRGNYNVTDYRWFDLRDGDSGDPDFGQQYGLMRDDYTPKPAFGAYRELVARLGAAPEPGAEPGPVARGRCLARRARVSPRGVAGARLGRRRNAQRRRLGVPARFTRRSDRWCVRGGGQVRAVYGARAHTRLVLTTARRHRIRHPPPRGRGVGPGSRRQAVLRAFPGARTAGSGRLRIGKVLFGLRRGRVRFVAVADRRTLRSPRLLRLGLRRAGAR